MNEVKRYKLAAECGVAGHMESLSGKWVKYEEYAALQQQLTATTNSLTNAQEALKSAGIEADTVQAGVVELVSRMNQVAAENYDLKHPGTYLPSKRETPATDAYLSAVRAEGVDKAIEHLHNKFASTGHVGVPVMALEWLSAELRVGNAGKDGSHE